MPSRLSDYQAIQQTDCIVFTLAPLARTVRCNACRTDIHWLRITERNEQVYTISIIFINYTFEGCGMLPLGGRNELEAIIFMGGAHLFFCF